MNTSADWKALLAALRAEGVPIGLGELIRLQQVFEQDPAPPLDRQGLKQLLACLLVKYPPQRETFERLFEQWCPEEAEELPKPESKLEPEPHPPTPVPPSPQPPSPELQPPIRKPPPRHRLPPETRWFLVVIGLVMAVFLSGLCYWWMSPRVETPEKETPIPIDTSPPPQPPDELPSEPVPAFYMWRPEIRVIQPPWAENAWLLGVLGMASSLFLFQRYRRRHRLPDPAPAAPRQDIDWLPWLKLESRGPELLTPDEQRTLVWGIGHFVSDEPTQTLDIDRTVTATARAGGIPELRYQPAVYPREVWLWQDSMTQNPLMERVVQELETALQRAGLPVRTGWFTDVPEQIIWQEGQVFSTLILEGHRQNALVAILTDGRGVRIANQSDLDRRPLAQLLSALGQWPHLAFVDVSRGQQGLAEVLRPYGLDCIAPEALPAFLGVRAVGRPPRRPGDERLLGELRVWAAALALSPEPVTEDEAYALRRALGLKVPPWALSELRQAVDAPGGRLAWPPQQRAELLNWLAQAEVHDGKVSRGSLLANTLGFWRARLRREHRLRRERQSDLEPWRGTLAAQRLKMERALLLLWQRPRWVAAILHSLYRGSHTLAEEIRTRLSALAAWEWRTSKQETAVVFLPWRETDQTDTTRYLLREMGFAGQVEQRPSTAGKLNRPSILSLTIGLCAGLGALALGISAWAWWRPAEPVLRPASSVFEDDVFRGLAIQQIESSGLGGYTVVMGTPRHVLQEKNVPAGSEVSVEWRWDERRNPEKFGDSELWGAGTLPQVIRGCEPGWPRRSLVVIAADPADKAARQLTIRLLDKGSADAVLMGKDWEAHYREALIQVAGAFTEQDQLLVIVPAKDKPPPQPVEFQGRYTAVAAKDFVAMAKALDFAGLKPLPEVWKPWMVKTVNGEQGVLLRGGPAEETDPASGVRFVQVCGGTFTMGSADQEQDAYDDEKPAHQVALSPFEIGKYEVTFQEYDRFAEATGRKKPDDREWGRGRRPVIYVSWDDAKAFCEHYGYSLPTEAQWEYAARAGSTTRWSFGDNEQELGRYAWFSGNANNQTHPVGEKAANPLGLYDMHGNVWEWVEDYYDEKAYRQRESSTLTIDPLETGGSLRVRRGGAYWVGAGNLRSADRSRDEPVNRFYTIGVRCVRGPRRQPP